MLTIVRCVDNIVTNPAFALAAKSLEGSAPRLNASAPCPNLAIAHMAADMRNPSVLTRSRR
jgi:hypothetical protein